MMASGQDFVIEVRDIQRVYKAKKGLFNSRSVKINALDGVSFTISRGELFGLLGPNGAGKTTLTKILATILVPTSGLARVMGFDLVKEARKCRPLIGLVLGGERGLYGRLSGRANLEYFAALYHVPQDIVRARIPYLLDLVGLGKRADERVENYSRGMRQRLHIARALVHNPPVLMLDEPTMGLDPGAAREMRWIIRNLKDQGKTIFLTTHYMYEADELCDRVAILSRGKVLKCDAPSALKAMVTDTQILEIETFGVEGAVLDRLKAIPNISAVLVQRKDHAQIIQIQSRERAVPLSAILGVLEGVRLGKIVSREPSLEDAYLRLVGPDAYNV